jgi:hypothetical protein
MHQSPVDKVPDHPNLTGTCTRASSTITAPTLLFLSPSFFNRHNNASTCTLLRLLHAGLHVDFDMKPGSQLLQASRRAASPSSSSSPSQPQNQLPKLSFYTIRPADYPVPYSTLESKYQSSSYSRHSVRLCLSAFIVFRECLCAYTSPRVCSRYLQLLANSTAHAACQSA